LFDVVCPTIRNQIKEEKIMIDMNRTPKTNVHFTSNSSNTVDSEITKETIGHIHDLSKGSGVILLKYEQQRELIKEALNKQTCNQFFAYAQQAYPRDPEKHEKLIKHLQEKHYEQYISQVYAHQLQDQAALIGAVTPIQTQKNRNTLFVGNIGESKLGSKQDTNYMHLIACKDKLRTVDEQEDEHDSDASREEENEDSLPSIHGQLGLFCHSNPKIAPATMWSSKDIQEFKDSIRKENSDGVLKVGHGEMLTVRVPTHPEGTSLYWEFSTDNYDIGFGAYFEWVVEDSSQVTVQVEESVDEDNEEETEIEASSGSSDIESGAGMNKSKGLKKPHTDEIIPVFRRNCHHEVIIGNHVYPGCGVYLLKFDNSYSLWRSKTLYYRVFYSK